VTGVNAHAASTCRAPVAAVEPKQDLMALLEASRKNA
jgi:hypothetical protein